MSDANDAPISDYEQQMRDRAAAAEAVVSPEQQLIAVTSELASLTSSIERCELFLQAFTEMELRQGFICELVKRSVSKLSPFSRKLLEHDGVLAAQSSRKRLLTMIVFSFAGVVIISAAALAWSATRLVPKDSTESSAAPMLLTLFTTAVGFLGGCGLFAPQRANQAPKPPQRIRRKNHGATNSNK